MLKFTFDIYFCAILGDHNRREGNKSGTFYNLLLNKT